MVSLLLRAALQGTRTAAGMGRIDIVPLGIAGTRNYALLLRAPFVASFAHPSIWGYSGRRPDGEGMFSAHIPNPYLSRHLMQNLCSVQVWKGPLHVFDLFQVSLEAETDFAAADRDWLA